MSQPIYPLYQPQVLQETCEGICRFDVRDQMLANRELELCGPIDAESAAILIRNLLYLQRADAVAPIKMFINSPGGEGVCDLVDVHLFIPFQRTARSAYG